MRNYHVYILAAGCRTGLEVGASASLIQRVWHLRRQGEQTSGMCPARRLVWCECWQSAEQALMRERELQRWPQEWLCTLVENENPLWLDLYPDLLKRTNVA